MWRYTCRIVLLYTFNDGEMLGIHAVFDHKSTNPIIYSESPSCITISCGELHAEYKINFNWQNVILLPTDRNLPMLGYADTLTFIIHIIYCYLVCIKVYGSFLSFYLSFFLKKCEGYNKWKPWSEAPLTCCRRRLMSKFYYAAEQYFTSKTIHRIKR